MHIKRFKKTLEFLEGGISKESRILDIGTPNTMGEYLTENGYSIDNAFGEDFDTHPEIVAKDGYDVATAFEILEHLVNPMGVLKELKTPKLVASIPLRLWFKSAYRNLQDPWDQHYHEFEDWQFNWLLEKSGWKITRTAKWTSPVNKLGFRPILRKFTPRYYIVEAERVSTPD